MIYCLIGHSSSGKSTIERGLEGAGCCKRIVSYTTRPKRVGEVEGEDYHFITEERFAELNTLNHFTETAQYRDWHYGLSLEFVGNYTMEDYVAVVTLEGYYMIENDVGAKNVTAIFIQVSERERMRRLLNRGDDVDEIIRRIQNDRVDFYDAEMICDYTIVNEDIDESIEFVKSIMNGQISI